MGTAGATDRAPSPGRVWRPRLEGKRNLGAAGPAGKIPESRVESPGEPASVGRGLEVALLGSSPVADPLQVGGDARRGSCLGRGHFRRLIAEPGAAA